jgi:hypothetical protein
MCSKCVEIDDKIARYITIVRSIVDPLTVDRTNGLIVELLAQKAILHPEKTE